MYKAVLYTNPATGPEETDKIWAQGTPPADPPRTLGHGNPGKGSPKSARFQRALSHPKQPRNGQDTGSRDPPGSLMFRGSLLGWSRQDLGSFQRALPVQNGRDIISRDLKGPPADPRSREPRQRVPEVGPVPTSPLPSKTAQKRPRYGLQGPPGEFDVQGVFAGLE